MLFALVSKDHGYYHTVAVLQVHSCLEDLESKNIVITLTYARSFCTVHFALL